MKKETYVERIRELREEDGISQAQLAEKTGLSQSAISAWEIGSRVPSAEVIIVLSKYFKVTSDYILGLSDKID